MVSLPVHYSFSWLAVLVVEKSVCRSEGEVIGWLEGQLLNQSINQLVGILAAGLVIWSKVTSLVDWYEGQLIGWSVGETIDQWVR